MRPDQKLNSAGLKATSPRVWVLELFRSREHLHLTVEQVYRILADQGTTVGTATAYRVLSQLTDAGLLSRTVFDSGKSVYELASDSHHHHLLCLTCARVEEFSDAEFERSQRTIAKAHDFTLSQHPLVLRGYCSQCRTPAKAPKKSNPSATRR